MFAGRWRMYPFEAAVVKSQDKKSVLVSQVSLTFALARCFNEAAIRDDRTNKHHRGE
jgi:hypothetical protein